jgi:hypothetical protein
MLRIILIKKNFIHNVSLLLSGHIFFIQGGSEENRRITLKCILGKQAVGIGSLLNSLKIMSGGNRGINSVEPVGAVNNIIVK